MDIFIRRIFILTYIFCTSVLCAFSQMARLYTMEQGLTTTRLSSSYVDRNGILWVMGERQLSYFDGGRFHSVIADKSDFLSKVDIVYAMVQVDESIYYVGTGLGLYKFDSSTCRFEQIDLGESKSGSQMPGFPVSSLRANGDCSRVLVTTYGFGSFFIDTKTGAVDKKYTESFSKIIQDDFVYDVFVDSKHLLWVSTSIDPIVAVSTKDHKKRSVKIAPDLSAKIKNGCPIVQMEEDPVTTNVLMAVPGVGLLIYDRQANEIREIRNNIKSINPFSLIYTKLGGFFVGSDNAGILEYDRTTESLSPVTWEVPGLDLGVSKVHHIAEDVKGNLIASLYQNGVLIVPSHINKMTYIPVSRKKSGFNSSPVSCLMRAGDKYWICTDGSGMFSADYVRFNAMENMSEGLNTLQMTAVTTDANGSVWAASYGGGLQMLEGDRWTTPSFVSELSSQNVLGLAADKKTNNIYVCINGSGLYEVDVDGKSIKKIDIPEIGNRWVAHAMIDSKRNLWIMFANGLCYLNLDSRKAKVVDLSSVSNSNVNDMVCVDGKVYFATGVGLATYSQKDNKLVRLEVSDKLSEGSIMSIQPVGKDLWLALSHGIAHVGADGTTVTNYTSFPGFYIGELHRRSKMFAHEDFVCFGGDNGIVAISTRIGEENGDNVDRLIITGLSVNGKSIVYDPDSNDNILDRSILWVNAITLNHDQNTFTIDFGSTCYAYSDEIVFEYMLEGYEDIWHETSFAAASAYYSSVPPGKYTFRIRAHYNNSEECVERCIDVTIRHPWYATWWAVMLYLLIACVVAWYVWRFYKERNAEKEEMKMLQRNEQIKEAKLRLFTSIAHELRTPLTMIVSPLKQLMSSDTDRQRLSSYNVMQRNCDRLLNIVKQITDVRKIDNGQLRLHFSEFDIVAYTEELMESFSGVANAKNIHFSLCSGSKPLMLWADGVHLEKIVINLLSNAFKFTPSDGEILISLECCDNNDEKFADKRISRYLRGTIFNSGAHIDERDLGHIYERFYQGHTKSPFVGSGIGLNLTYQLVNLHHGTIEVKNVKPDGVQFEVCLPLGCAHLTEEELIPRELPDESEASSNKAQIESLTKDIVTEQNVENVVANEKNRKKHLLIVDDDRELCEYMRSQLAGEFAITICFSGNSAWKQVLALRPDAVVTDLKMPDGDGLELCKNIKQNSETSHIPVIMLTAEKDEESQINSIGVDVDRFLTKPFNIVLLRGILGQMFRARETVINKVNRTGIKHDYNDVSMESYEDKFYMKVNDCIHQHLDDSDYTVEALAKEVGVSRVHLNRKLKEHYGVSPNAFIRSVRLKQAAYLLVNNKVNISEVAYKVGFASHSYFSNNFHDYFGMTPTEFVAYYSEEDNEEQLRKLLAL